MRQESKNDAEIKTRQRPNWMSRGLSQLKRVRDPSHNCRVSGPRFSGLKSEKNAIMP